MKWPSGGDAVPMQAQSHNPDFSTQQHILFSELACVIAIHLASVCLDVNPTLSGSGKGCRRASILNPPTLHEFSKGRNTGR